jgi:hypothetical protein
MKNGLKVVITIGVGVIPSPLVGLKANAVKWKDVKVSGS